MKVLRTVEEMCLVRTSVPSEKSVAFVPTMGCLHDGHLGLVRAARKSHGVVVVSIYVNSAQFGVHEDLARYPVTTERDLGLLDIEDVDVVFMPAEKDVYPASHATWCETAIGDGSRNTASEGAFRSTFFRGVATVMCKLLNVVRPDVLYCGQKDAQQCAVMRALGVAFWPQMQVVVVPTGRAEDGLALSSRNRYLSVRDRARAPALYRALRYALHLFHDGERDAEVLREKLRAHIDADGALEVLYVSVCDKLSMKEVGERISEPFERATLVCLAAKIDDARLIDNCELTLVENTHG